MPEPTARQQRAIETRDPLHVVSAGAGSGKTLVLIERIVRLAHEGTGPGRVLAITFTEKAAAELKHRLVEEFRVRGMDDARREAEAAYISTIHGFCARILREWPLEARIDPGFGIITPIDEALFFDDQLEQLYADPEFAELDAEYGADGWADDGRTLFEIVKQLIATTRELGGMPADLEAGADPVAAADQAATSWEAWLRARWVEMLGGLEDVATLTTPEYVGGKSGEKYARLCGLVEELTPEQPRWELAAELWELIGFYTAVRKPEKEEWKGYLEPVRAIADRMRMLDLGRATEREREAARRRTLVQRWAARVWRHFEEHKVGARVFDFQDLQLRALALLDDPRVRDHYRRQFRHILLDEAQDTNPLQYRILKERLWGGGNAFFAVGDAKQAIYGFRGADLGRFLDLVREAGESRTELTENFRSRGAILDGVNAMGRAFWAGDALLGDFALEPRFPYPPDPWPSPRIEACVVEQRSAEDEDRKHEALDDARAREAKWVAERLQRLVREEYPVYDTREGCMRPFQWGDAAVLLRTHRSSGALEHVFRDAGIPYVNPGGAGFFDGLEVKDLLAGLAVIANPLDDLALLSALRSPLCGLSDDALVALRMARGAERVPYWTVSGTAELPASDRERLDRFVDTVEALRAIRDAATPERLTRELIDRTDYLAHLFTDSHGRARAANIRRLQAFARRHRALSLGGFLQHARRAARYLRENPDAPLAERGDPAVTLTTIHRAKGLEWPVVVLADLAAEYWRGPSSSGVAPDGRLFLSVRYEKTNGKGDWHHPLDAEAIRLELERADREEAQRLLYVAATRSRELLVLSGVAKDGRAVDEEWKQRPIHWLRAQLGLGKELGDAAERRAWGEAEVSVSYVRADEPRPEHHDAARSLFHVHRRSLEEGRPLGDGRESALLRVLEPLSIRQPPVAQLAVTRLTGFLRCPLVYRFSELGLPEYPSRPQRGGGAGADLGNWVHHALRQADFDADTADEVRRLMRAAPGPIPDAAEEMIERALRSPLADEIRAAGQVHREVPFYVPVQGPDGPLTVLHGIVDLAFQDGAGAWHIVDWKTNAIRDEQRQEMLTKQYTPQIQLYAAALASVYHTIGSGRLVFLSTGVTVDIPIDRQVLDRALDAARIAVARIGAGDYHTRSGAKCRDCGYRRGKWCEVGKAYAT